MTAAAGRDFQRAGLPVCFGGKGGLWHSGGLARQSQETLQLVYVLLHCGVYLAKDAEKDVHVVFFFFLGQVVI